MNDSVFDKSILEKPFWDKYYSDQNQVLKPFFESLEQENDRAFAIISACLIDNILERVISAFFIKDPAVKSMFKKENFLQSLYSKICFAYFSGLIPKTIYKDLKLICKIRNMFAHETIVNISFQDTAVSQRINSCEIKPKGMAAIHYNRLKFMLIVEQLIIFLCYFENLLLFTKPPKLVDSFQLNDKDWSKLTLSEEQIFEALKKKTLKNNR